MAKNEGNKLERIFRILATLSEYEWTHARDIAEMLGVDKRTVFRYIKDINIPFEENGPGLIESSNEFGYRLKSTNFIDKLKGIDDLQTIAAIQTSPYAHNLMNRKIVSQDMMERVIPRLNQTNYIDDDTLKHLLDALYKGRILEVEYQKSGSEPKKYKILPLKLVSNGGTNYLNLYCFDEGYERILSFMVSKIVKISLKEVCRDKKLIESKLDFINSRWGIFVNEVDGYIDSVKFEVNDSLYQNLIKQPLHSSQEYIYSQGAHIFTLKIHNILEFARWTMKFGYQIRVIESQAVINAIKSEAYQLVEKYEE